MATFDERAAEWDTPERIERAAAVARAIRETVAIPPGTRAIEIGAGTGLLGLELVDAIDELVLGDTSVGMLEVADAKIRERGLRGVRTARFDLVSDPPPATSFDLALSLLVLHHVEDTSAALAAMHRLLAPGGRIAVADLDTEDGTFHSADAEGIHHLGFDRDALGRLAERAGFVDVAFTTAVRIQDEGRDYPVFLLTARRA